MYQIGDKILCKKSANFDYPWIYRQFIKGETYVIDKIVKSSDVNGIPFEMIYVQDISFDIQDFETVFHNQKEIRKLKLLKLNDQ